MCACLARSSNQCWIAAWFLWWIEVILHVRMCRSRESMGAPAKGSGATRVGAKKFRDIQALGLSKNLLSQIYEMLVRYAEESTPQDECED